MNTHINLYCSPEQPLTNTTRLSFTRLSLSNIASGILLLTALLFPVASASAGTVTIQSDNKTYAVVIDITAVSLSKTANGNSSFNYKVNLEYNISFTGAVPEGFSLYHISGAYTNTDGSQSFPLPNAGGKGVVQSYGQTHYAFSDFDIATPESLGTSDATIALSGPGLAQKSIPLSLGASVPLPVQVKTFTAMPSNEGVQVAWETLRETQVQSFTIERSPNGHQWQNVATVAAKATTTTGATYAITDKVALEGKTYYRLSELGVNGATIYYNTVVVTRNTQVNTTPQVFPNPNAGNTLYFTGLESSDPWVLSIVGAAAQNVNMLSVTNGQVTLPELTAGLYFLSLRNTATGAVNTFRYSKL